MTAFEYKVVPAPKKGLKAKGVKGSEARFANALQTIMNELGTDGWEYQRTDTLPCEERQGLTGKTTSFQNMLVFRRALVEPIAKAPAAALIEDHSERDQAPLTENIPLESETQEVDLHPEPDHAIEPEPENDQSEPSDTQIAAMRSKLDSASKPTVTMPWSSRRKDKSDDPQVAAE